MKIKLIGDRFTCSGFNLAGINTVTVEDSQQLKDKFDEFINDENLAMLLITEKQADIIRSKVEEQKIERELPLVVEIPDRDGWQEREKVLKLINKTLSIDL